MTGALFANAQSERGPHPIDVDTTTLVETASDGYVLSGRKFYSTGALFADWVIVRAFLGERVDAQGAGLHPERRSGTRRRR